MTGTESSRGRIQLIAGLLLAGLLVVVPACSDTNDPVDVTDTGDTSDDTADTTPAAPELTSLSPERVIVGDVLTISGVNLGDGDGSAVTVGGVSAEVISWSATVIEIEVPDVLPGEQPVVVTLGDDATDGLTVAVLLPRRAYVALGTLDESVSDGIAILEVGADGALTELDSSPFSVGVPTGWYFGGAPGNLAIDEARRRLFFSGTNGIAIMAIDPRDGTLAHVPGSPFVFTGVGDMYGLAVAPGGQDLYVNRSADGELVHYPVAADGSISTEAAVAYAVTSWADAVHVTPDGQFVYTTSGTRLHGFLRTAATGALTEIDGSPWDIEETYGCSLNPSGSRLYCGAYDNDEVFALDVHPTSGALTETAGSPWSVDGSGPINVAFHPDGSRLWVSMWYSDEVTSFNVAGDGSLSASQTLAIVVQPAPSAVSRDGAVLVVLGQNGESVASFAISGSGFASAGDDVVLPEGSYPSAVQLAGFR